MTIEARFRITKGDFTLDVELGVPARGVTAVLGPSGCGKTTLLRAIAGLDRCPGGYLSVNGVTWQDGDRFLPTHRRSLGYVFQEPSLFPHLSVGRNLEYGLRRKAESERRVSLENATQWLGIRDLLGRDADTLSGGERQRVAIARALAASPGLLLLDEPLAALDAARKREIMPYLDSLHDELDIPVLYVSHSPDEVARLADHVVLLDGGRIKAEGQISDILTRLDLPVAHGADAEALIAARVSAHDDDYGLTYLDFPAGRITVSRMALPVGHPVRLRVPARDVSLTLERQTGTSILNIFPAVIDGMVREDDAQVTVRLLAGGVPLLSRVTRKSAAALELAPGKTVFAQAKSIAVLS